MLPCDVQSQHEALNDARRLLKHHPEVIKAGLHELVGASLCEMMGICSSKGPKALLHSLKNHTEGITTAFCVQKPLSI